jgi:hypothetical protein
MAHDKDRRVSFRPQAASDAPIAPGPMKRIFASLTLGVPGRGDLAAYPRHREERRRRSNPGFAEKLDLLRFRSQ